MTEPLATTSDSGLGRSTAPKPEPIVQLLKCHIRAYHPSDTARLAQIADNPKVAKYLRNIFPQPYTTADAEFWIARTLALDPLTQFCICTNAADERGAAGDVVGGIGLVRQPDVHCRTWELGYWLAEPYWGQGIATEAVRGFVRWAFARFGDECQRVFAGIFCENVASKRVLEKAGFVFEGRLRAAVWKEDRVMDMLLYSVVRGDWGDGGEQK